MLSIRVRIAMRFYRFGAYWGLLEHRGYDDPKEEYTKLGGVKND